MERHDLTTFGGIKSDPPRSQTHVARQLVKKLGSIPTVIILSQVNCNLPIARLSIEHGIYECQDSFYKFHSPEELALAHANMLDFDHPDALDMPMFAAVRPHMSPVF